MMARDDRRHDDSDGRHNGGSGRHDDKRHDDGKGQQGNRRHDNGDGRHDYSNWRHNNGRHNDGKGQKEAAAPPPPACQWQHHRENIYKSRQLGLVYTYLQFLKFSD